MGKHSRYVIDICDTMTCNTQSSNVDRDIIMHQLPKDEAVKAAWINTILKGRKQLIQESLHTSVTTSLLDWLINPSQCLIKSIQVQ